MASDKKNQVVQIDAKGPQGLVEALGALLNTVHSKPQMASTYHIAYSVAGPDPFAVLEVTVGKGPWEVLYKDRFGRPMAPDVKSVLLTFIAEKLNGQGKLKDLYEEEREAKIKATIAGTSLPPVMTLSQAASRFGVFAAHKQNMFEGPKETVLSKEKEPGPK